MKSLKEFWKKIPTNYREVIVALIIAGVGIVIIILIAK